MGKLTSLYASMLKIGIIGFGGGSALIPVIEEEIVEEKKTIDETAYNADVVVASITPGALPVEIATGIGKRVGGVPAMVTSASLMALPGTLLTVLMLMFFSQSGDGILTQIGYASVGVTMYIIYMLLCYAVNTVYTAKKIVEPPINIGQLPHHSVVKSMQKVVDHPDIIYKILLILTVFFLTGDKKIYKLLSIDATPLFSFSTINTLLLFFFAICYIRNRPTVIKCIVTAILGVLYVIAAGTNTAHFIPIPHAKAILRVILCILMFYGIYRSGAEEESKKFVSIKGFLKEFLGWLAFLIILSIPAFILYPQMMDYLLRGISSAFVSFGGGDAYLAVANGMFVQEGYVDSKVFYEQIVSVANVMPGSILCKILTAMGYYVGFQAGGYSTGLALSLCGFACSVSASGVTFCAVSYLYTCFEQLTIFQLIKKWIRPVISGLMLTVCCSMFSQNITLCRDNNWPIWIMLLLSVVVLAINHFGTHTKKKIHPIILIVISALLSMGVCNLLRISY